MLDEYLPAALRGPATKITRIAAGLSGAGVYRVEAAGQTYVLKHAPGTPLADWERRLAILQSAAAAGVAPVVIHADATHRAVTSAFVADRGFAPFFFTARDAAVDLLGATLRRVHALPIPDGAPTADPRAQLTELARDAPALVQQAAQRVLAESPPAMQLVLSHNDVNPSNLIYDGERLLLLDWDVAAPNDVHYDYAAIAVFLRMDEPTCLRLLAVPSLPPAFLYARRLVGALCGAMFVRLAGSGSAEAIPLADVYQRMRAGTLNVASPEGQWLFGLGLARESLAL